MNRRNAVEGSSNPSTAFCAFRGENYRGISKARENGLRIKMRGYPFLFRFRSVSVALENVRRWGIISLNGDCADVGGENIVFWYCRPASFGSVV